MRRHSPDGNAARRDRRERRELDEKPSAASALLPAGMPVAGLRLAKLCLEFCQQIFDKYPNSADEHCEQVECSGCEACADDAKQMRKKIGRAHV